MKTSAVFSSFFLISKSILAFGIIFSKLKDHGDERLGVWSMFGVSLSYFNDKYPDTRSSFVMKCEMCPQVTTAVPQMYQCRPVGIKKP